MLRGTRIIAGQDARNFVQTTDIIRRCLHRRGR